MQLAAIGLSVVFLTLLFTGVLLPEDNHNKNADALHVILSGLCALSVMLFWVVFLVFIAVSA